MEQVVSRARAQYRRFWQTIAKRDLLLAGLVALSTVVFGVFLGHENNGIIPLNPLPLAHYTAEPHNPLRFMADWDGPVYLAISRHSYSNASLANFFPLYPLLIRALNLVIGSPLYSALLIAWAGFTGGLYYYLKIIKKLFTVRDNREALRGVLFFVLFPTGVFLIAPYTEGLLACLTLGAVYYTLQKRLVPASLLLLLATATHETGVFVLILIGIMLLEQRQKLATIALTLAVGSFGLVGYMIFLLIRFHNALAFITAQKQHGWLEHHYSNLLAEFSLINVLLLILLAISVWYWYKRRPSFAAYSFLYLCVPFVGGQLGGFNRYALMAFPVQWMLYERFRKSALAYALVLAISSVLWAHYLFQYAGGYIGG